jgi:hypothetical protein
MKTLNVNVVSTVGSAAKKLELNFYDFELGVGLKFQYRIFNQNNYSIDGGSVILDGMDFQDWPPAPLGDEEKFDEDYIISKLLPKLNLEKDSLSEL